MEPFISLICLWGPNFAPKDWAFCAGGILQISQNQSLFALIGATYGGDGRTSMGLPDFRGRVPVGAGQSPGTSYYVLGKMGGTEFVSLSMAEMPIHNHATQFDPTAVTLKASPVAGTEKVPGTNNATTLAASDQGRSDASNIYNSEEPTVDLNMDASFGGAVTVLNAGGGQSHYNVQPYTVVNYIIALKGIFPSRS